MCGHELVLGKRLNEVSLGAHDLPLASFARRLVGTTTPVGLCAVIVILNEGWCVDIATILPLALNMLFVVIKLAVGILSLPC